MYCENIIIGAGPAGLQLAYFFKKANINYLILEKESSCASFFKNYPISDELISLNKKYTGETNDDFNLRHDWNSLLNDEKFLFTDLSDELYPSGNLLYEYLNEFYKKFELNVKFNTSVNVITKINNQYVIKINDNETYICDKLIMANGLSVPNYPKNISISNDIKIKHYKDLNKNFKNKNNLNNYINKKILIIGGGNSSYEIANILQQYCSTIIILGSNKKLSIVSHYVGDIRSKYLNFLDTFYLKSLNGIDVFDKNTKLEISHENDKYYLKNYGNTYYTDKLKDFDEIILCTGWSFNKTIFDFNVSTVCNDKYPHIKENYESQNNDNLYFIGSLMHSRDYKKGSGGFIHGFRYLLKFFTVINYNLPKNIFTFKFSGNMDCYKELSNHIFNRINYSSSLYQLYGTMCDVFYYDNEKKSIIYIQDWTIDCIQNLQLTDIKYINYLTFEYGPEENLIHKLGSFNKWNPSFLHPRIYLFENKKNDLTLLDRIIFEENLIADFSSPKIYNKITQTLKMCNLII
jgi:thioredoxin reductase